MTGATLLSGVAASPEGYVSTSAAVMLFVVAFVAGWLVRRAYAQDAPAPMIECHDCGRVVDNNAFCGSCGAELDFGRADGYDSPEESGRPIGERIDDARDRLANVLPGVGGGEDSPDHETETVSVEVDRRHTREALGGGGDE